MSVQGVSYPAWGHWVSCNGCAVGFSVGVRLFVSGDVTVTVNELEVDFGSEGNDVLEDTPALML